MDYIKSKIRDVVDFPTKGIVFKDLTTVFKDPRALHIIGWDLSQLYRDKVLQKLSASNRAASSAALSSLMKSEQVSYLHESPASSRPTPSAWSMPKSTAPT